MHAKSRCLLSALVLVCTLLAVPAAHALVINASDYRVGANLTDIFAGVTLEYATHVLGQGSEFDTSPLIVGAHTFGDAPENPLITINTLGSYTDGDDFGTDLFNTDSEWHAVEAIFTASVMTVSVVSFADQGDSINDSIFAYSAAGTYLGVARPSSESCVPTVSPPGYCLGEYAVTTYNSTTPIGFILLTSTDSPAYVTGIDIPGVPEPSSLALFAASLLAIGLVTLRGRCLP